MRSPVWISAMVNGRMPKLAAVGDVIETPKTCASKTHSQCMFREKTLFIFCAECQVEYFLKSCTSASAHASFLFMHSYITPTCYYRPTY